MEGLGLGRRGEASEEPAVEPGIVGKLGMERGAQEGALPHCHDASLVFGQDVDFRSGGRDDRRSDEDSRDGFGQPFHADRVLEAMDLGAEGVAAHGDVEYAEAVLIPTFYGGGHHHQAHTGPPNGHSFAGAGLNRLAEAEPFEEEANGGAFAAGNDQPLDAVEVLDRADFVDDDVVDARAFHRSAVLVEITLDCEDSDAAVHGQECTDRPVESGGCWRSTACRSTGVGGVRAALLDPPRSGTRAWCRC